MFLKRVKVDDFRVVKNVDLTFESDFEPSTFPLGSLNGGGKSTLLQLIFTLLHCSFDEAKHQYLVNLLSPVAQDKPDYFLLAKFELIHNDRECSLEFILMTLDNDNFIFRMGNEEIKKQYELLSEIIQKLNELDINNPSIATNFALSLSPQLRSSWGQNMILLFTSIGESNTQDENIAQIEKVKESCNSVLLVFEKLQTCRYIADIGCKVHLFCKTAESLESLKDIATHIYLAAPSTQVFLFLSSLAKQALFSTTTSYNEHVNKAKNELLGLFTYDFAPIKIIIDAFVKARDKDFNEALDGGGYGNNLQKLRTDLDSFFFGKSITVNKELNQVIFKLKETGEELSPEDLSHGELKKLGIYVWLKYQDIENALVLMDEIEIGLHPDWQYEIANELQDWSHGNQFILATHSYELCQALTPSHVKELSPKLIK